MTKNYDGSLWKNSLLQFRDRVAASSATPGGGAVAAGVIGGAVAAATSPLWAPGYYDYYPGYAYGPSYGYAVAPAAVVGGGDSVAYCESQFRSYNPATGMYLGYDGQYHPCP